MRCWHLTVASVGRLTLFPDEHRLRGAVRALARTLGAWLVLFCIVDDHVHVVVMAEEAALPGLGRRLRLALAPLLGEVRLAPTHLTPVETRTHLANLVSYLVRNPGKHGVAHPAAWSGTCFPDLAGARVLPGFDRERIAGLLPRWRVEVCCRELGLAPDCLAPLDAVEVRRLGAAAVVEAASAAVATSPGLTGRSAEVVLARAAAVNTCDRVGIARGETACALRADPTTVWRLGRRQVSADVLRAVDLRLALDRACRPMEGC